LIAVVVRGGRVLPGRGVGAAVLIISAFVLAGCGNDGGSDSPSVAVGAVVEIDRDAAGINGFTLTTDDGEVEILIADDVDYGFDLEHLREHQATHDPVRCRLEEREGRLYALSIEDA
jgi:hypothetical protein